MGRQRYREREREREGGGRQVDKNHFLIKILFKQLECLSLFCFDSIS